MAFLQGIMSTISGQTARMVGKSIAIKSYSMLYFKI